MSGCGSTQPRSTQSKSDSASSQSSDSASTQSKSDSASTQSKSDNGSSQSKSESRTAGVASRREPTQIVNVRPTTTTGRLRSGYTSASRLHGECLGGSRNASGAVYDCGAGGREHEPCWPLGAGHETEGVFCLEVPWRRSGTEIALTKRWEVRLYPPEPHRLVWRVELTTGQRCQPAQAANEYHGIPFRFLCSTGHVSLIGEPDEKREPWTIREVIAHPEKGGTASFSEGPLGRLAVVWYAIGASL